MGLGQKGTSVTGNVHIYLRLHAIIVTMQYAFSVDGLVDATASKPPIGFVGTNTYPVRDRGVLSAAMTCTLAVHWRRSLS